MRKRKGKDEGKQTLNTIIYYVVSLGTKPPLIHIVEALAKIIAFQSPSLFRASSWLATKVRPLRLTCYKGSATKAHAKSPITLMPPSLQSFPRRRDLLVPPHKPVVAAPHQVGGSKTFHRATKTQSRHTEVQDWGLLKNQHKVTTPWFNTLYS
jgi:hypothetical protein